MHLAEVRRPGRSFDACLALAALLPRVAGRPARRVDVVDQDAATKRRVVVPPTRDDELLEPLLVFR
jgi:hypothetical protein